MATRANQYDAPLLAKVPERVVSLVPSLTESLFDLGLGDCVVGITDYCIHPRERLVSVPRLGGTKNARIEDIQALEPDLVIANHEENNRETIEHLKNAGIPVWVTFPLTVADTFADLRNIARLFQNSAAFIQIDMLERAIEWTQSAAEGNIARSFFCPIWFDRFNEEIPWWMTFNDQTYCGDLLRILGGMNVFAERERSNPIAADLGIDNGTKSVNDDARYPRVSKDEVIAANPEIILLPDEPYHFRADHLRKIERLLSETRAVRERTIFFVDGTLITWHGTRLGIALRELPKYFTPEKL